MLLVARTVSLCDDLPVRHTRTQVIGCLLLLDFLHSHAVAVVGLLRGVDGGGHLLPCGVVLEGGAAVLRIIFSDLSASSYGFSFYLGNSFL